MTTHRRTITRGTRKRITPEAVLAWQACDIKGLQKALGLPFPGAAASPFPKTITALGVSEADLPLPDNPSLFEQTIPRALDFQRRLIAMAGWPNRGNTEEH